MKHTKGRQLKVVRNGHGHWGKLQVIGTELSIIAFTVATDVTPERAVRIEDDAERLASRWNACDRANLTNAQLDSGVLEQRERLLERCREAIARTVLASTELLANTKHSKIIEPGKETKRLSFVTLGHLVRLEGAVDEARQLLADLARAGEGTDG